MSSSLPPIPRHFRLNWIERKQDELSTLALPLGEVEVTASLIEQLLTWWLPVLDPSSRYPLLASALRQSLEYYTAQRLTQADVARVVRLLVANWHRLRTGQPVWPLVQPTQAEWLPAQIMEVEPVPAGERVRYSVMFLAGCAVDQTMYLVYTPRQCLRLALKLGFSQRSDTAACPYLHPRQLVQLRAWWYLQPGLPLRASEVALSPQFVAHNRRLVEDRQRLRFTCPLAKPATFPCFRCPAGYAPGSSMHCPVACRRQPRHV